MLNQLLKQLWQFAKGYTIIYWICMLLFCALSIYVYYFLELKQFMQNLSGLAKYIAYFTLYAIHILWGFCLYSLFFKAYTFWKKIDFWILLVVGVLIFTFRVCFNEHYNWIAWLASEENAWVYQSIFKHFFKLLYVVFPLFFVWFIVDRNTQPFYGFSSKQHKSKIYWVLLLAIIPLIVYASSQTDFLNFYPRASKLVQANASTPMLFLFEFFYGLDFISIELFFRGFLIMAFTRYVGVHAVFPMACFYLSIHYGKPMGEAISSFFGGTILGVIAYHSKSIYGGIIVHIGIAWLMELGGFIGNYLKQ